MPLLQHADLFVFPSTYEGFGLPVVDAQQAGVPVACSNAACLPEVAGKGAMYFDPLSVDDIANCISRLMSSPALRQSLVIAGRQNVQRFSWGETARRTLAVYDLVLSKNAAVRR